LVDMTYDAQNASESDLVIGREYAPATRGRSCRYRKDPTSDNPA